MRTITFILALAVAALATFSLPVLADGGGNGNGNGQNLTDVNTLQGVKTPPTDALWDWQAVSCGSQAEGDCDSQDLMGGSIILQEIDAESGQCTAKEYWVCLATDPKLLNLTLNPNMVGVTVIRVRDLNWTWVGCLTDGNTLDCVRVYAVCHGNGGGGDDDSCRH